MTQSEKIIYLKFLYLITGENWTSEYKFDEKRKWLFDFCHIDKKIAIEIEGAIFSNGRHSRGLGMMKDMEKYNTATINGWKVLRFTTPAKHTNTKIPNMRGMSLEAADMIISLFKQ